MPTAQQKTAQQRLIDLVDNFTADIRSAFLASIQTVANDAIINDMIRAIEVGDLEAAFRAVGFSPAAMRPITAAIERAYETGGITMGETFPKVLQTSNGKAVFRFDVRNSRAEAYLRDHSSDMVTRLTDEARSNVRTVLQEGMRAGDNPRTVALDIVGRMGADGNRSGGIIGLTENQASWVRSVERKLAGEGGAPDPSYFDMKLRDKRFDRTVAKAIDQGKPLDADTVQKLVSRYKDNALKHRGETIARTEALQSLNASEYEALKQAIDIGAIKEQNVKRIWDSAGDNRVRDTHREMDGQEVTLHEPFVSPGGSKLLYPGDTSLGADASEIINCRCRARTKVDWLADVD